MTREEFAHFVEKTVEEVICLAEHKGGKPLPRTFAFRWLGRSQPLVTENVSFQSELPAHEEARPERFRRAVPIGSFEVSRCGSRRTR